MATAPPVLQARLQALAQAQAQGDILDTSTWRSARTLGRHLLGGEDGGSPVLDHGQHSQPLI